MTWRKSKIVRAFLFLPVNICKYAGGLNVYLTLSSHFHIHTGTFSRLQAGSVTMHIHEMVVINVTEVILFLLARTGFYTEEMM